MNTVESQKINIITYGILIVLTSNQLYWVITNPEGVFWTSRLGLTFSIIRDLEITLLRSGLPSRDRNR